MDRPRMTREQVAKLVVGQEVNIRCGVYGYKGVKVVRVRDDGVDVLAPAASYDEMCRMLSEDPPHDNLLVALSASLNMNG